MLKRNYKSLLLLFGFRHYNFSKIKFKNFSFPYAMRMTSFSIIKKNSKLFQRKQKMSSNKLLFSTLMRMRIRHYVGGMPAIISEILNFNRFIQEHFVFYLVFFFGLHIHSVDFCFFSLFQAKFLRDDWCILRLNCFAYCRYKIYVFMQNRTLKMFKKKHKK